MGAPLCCVDLIEHCHLARSGWRSVAATHWLSRVSRLAKGHLRILTPCYRLHATSLASPVAIGAGRYSLPRRRVCVGVMA